MMFWWKVHFGLFFIFLSCEEMCNASPLDQPSSTYINSLRLTRSTRAYVQQLLRRYKEHHLGDRNFEDRSLQLKELPLLSTDFNSWLKMEDWDRLHAAYQDMRTFWDMLELKRKQLQKEEAEQRGTHRAQRRTKPTMTIPERIKYIQRNLRDLITHVNTQMRLMDSSKTSPTVPTASGMFGLRTGLPPQTLWDSHLEGYIILRDVELYLTRLARDFLLLVYRHRNHHDPHVTQP